MSNITIDNTDFIKSVGLFSILPKSGIYVRIDILLDNCKLIFSGENYFLTYITNISDILSQMHRCRHKITELLSYTIYPEYIHIWGDRAKGKWKLIATIE